MQLQIEHQHASNLKTAAELAIIWLESLILDEKANRRIVIEIAEGISDPEQLLFLNRGLARFCWKSRIRDFNLYALGIAFKRQVDSVESCWTEQIENHRAASKDCDLHWIGWTRFDMQALPDPEWESFDQTGFILPAIELVEIDGAFSLSINLPAVGDTKATSIFEISLALEKLLNAGEAETEIPIFAELNLEFPALDEWLSRISVIHNEMTGESDLAKLVLARYEEYTLQDDPDPLLFLQILGIQQEESFRFLLEPQAGTVFFGASPELLYCRDKRLLSTEALAGTRPRGNSEIEDEEFSCQLLDSAKDLKEQQIVSKVIADKLAMIAENVSSSSLPRLRKLKEVQHLLTEIKAILNKNISDRQILCHLHPTPAVAGFPVNRSCKLLAEIEDFDRGLYAGTMGIYSKEYSEVSVLIRSALYKKNRLRLYAGAGIMPDSIAESEWCETKSKMKLFHQMLKASVEQ
jgi:menaquinone-specific isochorismate synthase